MHSVSLVNFTTESLRPQEGTEACSKSRLSRCSDTGRIFLLRQHQEALKIVGIIDDVIMFMQAMNKYKPVVFYIIIGKISFFFFMKRNIAGFQLLHKFHG